jgi:hypothetical protein
MTDIRQTSQYANYLKNIGWIVKRVDGVNYFIKKLPLIGSILKIQRPKEIRYKDIKTLSRKYRVFQIIIEPKYTSHCSLITSHGFCLNRNPYLPSKTLQIDLNQTKEQIFSNFKKDARLALRKNFQFPISNLQTEKKIEEFRKAWKGAVGLKRYIPPLSHLVALKKTFGKNCLFLLYSDVSKHQSKKAVSGAVFIKTKDIAYYWQAFTNKEGRKALAQYRIVWEGIKWAKKSGCKIFDFEGIYDERFPNKNWLGFTHFKKSFGGKEVEYPGCYIQNRFCR